MKSEGRRSIVHTIPAKVSRADWTNRSAIHYIQHGYNTVSVSVSVFTNLHIHTHSARPAGKPAAIFRHHHSAAAGQGPQYRISGSQQTPHAMASLCQQQQVMVLPTELLQSPRLELSHVPPPVPMLRVVPALLPALFPLCLILFLLLSALLEAL